MHPSASKLIAGTQYFLCPTYNRSKVMLLVEHGDCGDEDASDRQTSTELSQAACGQRALTSTVKTYTERSLADPVRRVQEPVFDMRGLPEGSPSQYSTRSDAAARPTARRGACQCTFWPASNQRPIAEVFQLAVLQFPVGFKICLMRSSPLDVQAFASSEDLCSAGGASFFDLVAFLIAIGAIFSCQCRLMIFGGILAGSSGGA
jgi:hypothetical protein